MYIGIKSCVSHIFAMFASGLLCLQFTWLTIDLVAAQEQVDILTNMSFPTGRPIPTLPPGYIRFQDVQTSYKIGMEHVNWTSARDACSFENARLAVIDTRPKLDHVISMRPRFSWVWTGIYREPHGSSNWKAVDGGSLIQSSLPWVPLSGIFEDCVAVSGLFNGLSSWACTKLMIYVCEIPDPVEETPDTIFDPVLEQSEH